MNYQDIAFNGAGLGGGAGMGGGAADQLGGLLAPVSVQNLAALAAMTQPVVSQPAAMAPTAAAAAPQPTAPQLCKLPFFCVKNKISNWAFDASAGVLSP